MSTRYYTPDQQAPRQQALRRRAAAARPGSAYAGSRADSLDGTRGGARDWPNECYLPVGNKAG